MRRFEGSQSNFDIDAMLRVLRQPVTSNPEQADIDLKCLQTLSRLLDEERQYVIAAVKRVFQGDPPLPNTLATEISDRIGLLMPIVYPEDKDMHSAQGARSSRLVSRTDERRIPAVPFLELIGEGKAHQQLAAQVGGMDQLYQHCDDPSFFNGRYTGSTDIIRYAKKRVVMSEHWYFATDPDRSPPVLLHIVFTKDERASRSKTSAGQKKNCGLVITLIDPWNTQETLSEWELHSPAFNSGSTDENVRFLVPQGSGRLWPAHEAQSAAGVLKQSETYAFLPTEIERRLCEQSGDLIPVTHSEFEARERLAQRQGIEDFREVLSSIDWPAELRKFVESGDMDILLRAGQDVLNAKRELGSLYTYSESIEPTAGGLRGSSRKA